MEPESLSRLTHLTLLGAALALGTPMAVAGGRKEFTKDQNALLELTTMAAANEGLEATLWWQDRAVLRRYLECGDVLANIPFITRTLAWRKANNVDKLLADREACEEEVAMRQRLLYDVVSTVDGRPVLIQRVGAWDVDALTEAIQTPGVEATIRRSHMLVTERMRCAVDAYSAAGGPCGNALLVFDFADMGLRHLSAHAMLNFLSNLFRDDRDHYPGIIGKIVVVNAPRAFSALWAIVSRWLHPDTAAKLTVFSHAAIGDAQQALRDHCGGAKGLPSELGGDREGARPYHFPSHH